MRSGKKDLQKVVRWFLDANDNPDFHQNLTITFWPIHNDPWNLHANSFRGICIKSTNQHAKCMLKQLRSFAQVIKFLKHIRLKRGLTPNTPPVYALGEIIWLNNMAHKVS